MDVGERRIGVAIGDVALRMASPDSVILRTSLPQDIAAVMKQVDKWGASLVVIGDPVRTDGKKVDDNLGRAFAKALGEKGVKILLWDERYSTQAAHRLLSHLDGRKKRSGCLDAVAAQWILQGYLDSLSHANRGAPLEEA